MANYTHKYQRVTRKQLINCVRWCQNILNLRDWQIEFYVGNPGENDRACGWTMAMEDANRYQYKAEIWIDIEWCKEKDDNPYVVVCHEMLHVLTGGKCAITDGDDEHLTYCLDTILYEKFCRDTGLKITKIRED